MRSTFTIFSNGSIILPSFKFTELHALTLVACSYVLLLKVMGYSLFITFNCAWDDTPWTLNWPDQVVVSIRRDLVIPTYCTMDNAGPDGAIFSLAVVILQRRKDVRCVQFYWTRGYFSKKNDVCNKMLHQVLKYIQICRSRVSFVAFSCLDGWILVQKFAKFDRP